MFDLRLEYTYKELKLGWEVRYKMAEISLEYTYKELKLSYLITLIYTFYV